MIKAKMVAVFAIMIAAVAVAATPAFAEFSSTNGKGTGAGKSGPVVLEGGGATLECSSAEGTGTISGGKEATKGPVLSLETKTWNGCKAKSSEFKGLTPKVKACTLKLTQAAGETKAKGSVATECTVATTVLFLTCTIHVSVEKAGPPAVNFGLEKNALANSSGNLIITAEDTGVTTTTSGTCPGIKGSSEGKQKATVTGEGVNEV